MSRRARIAEGGEVARPGEAILSPDTAEWVARTMTAAFELLGRRSGGGWTPNPELAEVRNVLSRATLTGAFAHESGVLATPQGGFVTAADHAARLGITEQAVTARCRAGAIPGAVQPHGPGTAWLIPGPDQEI